MSKPTISVIFPVYNAAAHIVESLNSILRQTFGDFEIILINDGSTDNTKDLILSISDKRIRYMENRRNLGLVHSLNKAIYYSAAPFIARMDADDIAFPQRFSHQLDVFASRPDLDILGTQTQPLGESVGMRYLCGGDLHRIYLLIYNTLSHPTIMMRRESLLKHRLYYDKSAMHAEDYKLWVDASICGLQLDVLDECLLKYRNHEGQVSEKYKACQEGQMLRIREAYASYIFNDLIFHNRQAFQMLLYGRHIGGCYHRPVIHLAELMSARNVQLGFFEPVLFDKFLDFRLDILIRNVNL
ncbi:glycosyltransferase family 2 protein [Chitinophaga sp. RAB17]|uniref:glycosyltransferase family 2 protein n=1 Tax=Chitinophaga sp. RAB17 TaxID=3233049 RepID=UPI003F904F9F